VPRYFFHLKDGNDVLRDGMGEEFATTEEAYRHALRVAFELGLNSPDRMRGEASLFVTDPANRVLFHIPLAIHHFKPR
jgi:uncharacterized protein DUF6894